jgi:hypothetical protein
MSDKNEVIKKEQRMFSYLLAAIDKNLSIQNKLLARLNIFLLILSIAAGLSFLLHLLIHVSSYF